MKQLSAKEERRIGYYNGRLDERIARSIEEHGFWTCEGGCGRNYTDLIAARFWRSEVTGRHLVEAHHPNGRVPRYDPGQHPGADGEIVGLCTHCHDATEPDPEWSKGRGPECSCPPRGHSSGCLIHGFKDPAKRR